jgi:putative transposase
MARYGEAFRRRVVARMLPPESAELGALSKEVGVSVQTLEKWREDVQTMPARGRAWSAAAGQWFFLYLILDLYSRKIVGWEVHADDHSDHATRLVQKTALAEGIAALDAKPVLHGDNGSTLKATTVLAMLHWLGIKPSYSRPRVSDDNAFVESLFRNVKYRPEFPAKGFADLEQARTWAASFVHWYNYAHRHSSIRYVTPAQRHAGEDRQILAARHAVYLRAREQNPARWSGATRNWPGHAQPGTRLRHKDAFGRPQFSGLGSMIQATTILTCAGL